MSSAVLLTELTVNSRVAGPRLGKDVQKVIQAAKSGDWSETNGVVTVGGIELVDGEFELNLVADVLETEDLIGILPGGGFVILDGHVTPELEAEGSARDLIRQVQQARKDAGLDVSDRIKLEVKANPELLAAVETHAELVKSETLTLELELVDGSGDPEVTVTKL